MRGGSFDNAFNDSERNSRSPSRGRARSNSLPTGEDLRVRASSMTRQATLTRQATFKGVVGGMGAASCMLGKSLTQTLEAPVIADVGVQTKKLGKWLRAQDKTLPEYNADMTLFSTLLSWKGTVMPLVLRKPSYYVLLLSHGLFVALKKYGGVDDWLEVEYSLMSVPTQLMVVRSRHHMA
tara:strand:+ start:133 stop:672 length:540 start_codon:yes stop_codon:yes gene_type:complete